MNRVQFMEQLKKLLSDISEEERQEALEYYESYFDDAGEDQEAEVIRELGSPGKVAAIIKEDLKGSSQNYGEFTENGFQEKQKYAEMRKEYFAYIDHNNCQRTYEYIKSQGY